MLTEGFYIDRDWQRVRLPRSSVGLQEQVLSATAYRNRDEMENILVIGDFVVDAGRRTVREPAELALGNWTLQGYPHRQGYMVYHYEFNTIGKVELAGNRQSRQQQLGIWKGVCAEIRVNGSSGGVIPLEDTDGVEITDCLREGLNRVDLEVAGSLRNLFGLSTIRPDFTWMDWSFFQGRTRTVNRIPAEDFSI